MAKSSRRVSLAQDGPDKVEECNPGVPDVCYERHPSQARLWLYSLYSRALFSSYRRPSALLLVMTLDLLEAPPTISEMASFPAIIVAPEDRDERTKTGTFDQTVLLDDKRDSGLGRELVEL